MTRATTRRSAKVVLVIVVSSLLGLGAATADSTEIETGQRLEQGAGPGQTTRLSVSSTGEQANKGGGAFGPAMSANARYVAFASRASNLVPGDTNRAADVFVRDRVAKVTRRVSIGPRGRQGNRSSFDPAISADGRFVAFVSDARNLVARDTNRATDVFVRDRLKGVTRLVSGGRGGAPGNAAVIFRPAVSGNGRFIVFRSAASNLVPRDTNNCYDLFLWNRATGKTTRVSVGRRGVQANDDSGEPTISPDGRYVAFQSEASNLVTGDTNAVFDVFIRDRAAGTTERVSVGQGGTEGDGGSFNPAISDTGRFVAFTSGASNLIATDSNGRGDVFVRDRSANATKRVSNGVGGQETNAFSGHPDISSNGRYVVFMSQASNVMRGDRNAALDVFFVDRATGRVRLVSVNRRGGWGNGESYRPTMSNSGRYVGFMSLATNLIARDTNDQPDVFLRERRP